MSETLYPRAEAVIAALRKCDHNAYVRREDSSGWGEDGDEIADTFAFDGRVKFEDLERALAENEPCITVATQAIREAVFDVTGDSEIAWRVVEKLRGDGSFEYAKIVVIERLEAK